ncbi:hypothetical protein QBC40DRAFT_273345 [Triangularia verruculosa]|uniref:Uncharacterized protein n=1 Tax=Triangularia verruculosa TaxID=2587418 RepID=A0AAN7AYY2_9PEZI|nr:hypothetical protein QBC40DRAFT_273345 [Triangularia verruculosa]
MALINPVHGLVVPFLFIFTLPLAIFAGITSALAFSVLMFRVAIVYLDIALAFVPQYFLRGKGRSSVLSSADKQRRHARGDGWKTPVSPTSSGDNTPSAFPQTTNYLNSGHISPASTHRRKSSYGFGGAVRRHSRRSSSQVSLSTAGTITPIHEGEVMNNITALTPAAFADAGLAPSVGLGRDYEGIGGWRLDDNGDDSDWTNINSRLELPLDGRTSFTRSHSRSQSAGPMNPNEPYLTSRHIGSRKETIMTDINHDWVEKSVSTGGIGAKAAGPTPNTSRVRLNQTIPLPSPAFTTLQAEFANSPEMLSPRSVRKTPPA